MLIADSAAEFDGEAKEGVIVAKTRGGSDTQLDIIGRSHWNNIQVCCMNNRSELIIQLD